MDYGELWESSLAKDEKGLDWTTLSQAQGVYTLRLDPHLEVKNCTNVYVKNCAKLWTIL